MRSGRRDNRIISRLLDGGVFTPALLKHYYRELCKETHPDAVGVQDSSSFLLLQEEYEEARLFLLDYRKKHPGAPSLLRPRLELHKALNYYTVSGLHSVRIRIKENLKVRNRKIMKEVIFWAGNYEEDFLTLFINYNKPFFRSFLDPQIEARLKKIKKNFMKGVRSFFDYQLRGLVGAGRSASSFLQEADYDLSYLHPDNYRPSYLGMIRWFLKELDLPPACKE